MSATTQSVEARLARLEQAQWPQGLQETDGGFAVVPSSLSVLVDEVAEIVCVGVPEGGRVFVTDNSFGGMFAWEFVGDAATSRVLRVTGKNAGLATALGTLTLGVLGQMGLTYSIEVRHKPYTPADVPMSGTPVTPSDGSLTDDADKPVVGNLSAVLKRAPEETL